MWIRSHNPATYDTNYINPFQPLRMFEYTSDLAYNPPITGNVDLDPNMDAGALAKAILVLSIEPIELVLPGPQTTPNQGSDYEAGKNSATYRRGRYTVDKDVGTSTLKAKIKVSYQDLFAFSDFYDDSVAGGAVAAVPHIMSEPIVIAEAYCPRIDLTWDYKDWFDGGENTPVGANREEPKVTGESQVFEWKQVLKESDQVLVGDSSFGGTTGKYVNRDKARRAAELFMDEFSGYGCKLVIDRAFWDTGPNQQSFSRFNPAGRAYSDEVEDREGTHLKVRGYIEVVEK